jgi:cyclopropane-fatty-acyl-phospholipid synthase
MLKPGGLFLNHGIARSASCRPARESFVDRYVFPDGQLITLSQALEAAESVGLEVRDVENLREHYERTLRFWVENLEQNRRSVLESVSERAYRIWLLYMAGSAAAFRRGDIELFQVLLSRPAQGESRLPLTREDLYQNWAEPTRLVATNRPAVRAAGD